MASVIRKMALFFGVIIIIGSWPTRASEIGKASTFSNGTTIAQAVTTNFSPEKNNTDKKIDIFDNTSKEDNLNRIDNKEKEKPTLEEMDKSMEKLKKDLEKLQKDLEKKQNKPDSMTKYTPKIGGMVIMGTDLVSEDESFDELYGPARNVFMIQDVRLTLTGSGYGGLRYSCDIGFNDGISFKDVDVRFDDVPYLGSMRFGHFRVESGLNFQEGAFNTTFVTRPTNTCAFRADRRLGIGSTHFFGDKRIRFFKGVYTGRSLENGKAYMPTDDGYVEDAGIILNTRLTALPIYRENSEGDLQEILHVGGSYYWDDPRNGHDNVLKLRSRPTSWCYKLPYTLQGTLPLDTETFSVAQAEIAWQKKQFAVESEFYWGDYSSFGNARGAHVIGRYVLTSGSYRKYDKEVGCFTSMHVPKNVRLVDCGDKRCLDGFGVWEVACMYSWTDMDNLQVIKNALYGQANEVTLGLNWYWNEQTRMAFDWTHSMLDSACAGSEQEKETRVSDTLAAQLRVRF